MLQALIPFFPFLCSIPLTIHILTEASLNLTSDHCKPPSHSPASPATLPENSRHVEVHTPLSLAAHTLSQGPQLAAAPVPLPLFALSPKSIPGSAAALTVYRQSSSGVIWPQAAYSFGLCILKMLLVFFLKVTYSKLKMYEEVYSESLPSHPFWPMLSVVPTTPFKCVHAGCIGVTNSGETQSQAVTGPGSNSWPVGLPADRPRPGDAQDPAGWVEESGPFGSRSYPSGSSLGAMGVATT